MSAQIAQGGGGAAGAEKGRPLILAASHQRPKIRHVCAQRRVFSP